MSTKKKATPPQAMKNLLIGVFVVLILAGGAGFYFGLTMLREHAIEANKVAADASASNQQTEQLQTLKTQLADSGLLVAKAEQIFATGQNYQPQALVDIRAYASKAGITVSKIDFEENSETNPQNRVVSVSLQNPVSYQGLLIFLNGIEGNLPKMQVSTIGISRTDNPSLVNVNSLKLNISIR